MISHIEQRPRTPRPGGWAASQASYPPIFVHIPEFHALQQRIQSLPREIQDAILTKLLRKHLFPGLITLDVNGRYTRCKARRVYNRHRQNIFCHEYEYFRALDLSIFRALNRKWTGVARIILYAENIWAVPCSRLQKPFHERWRVDDILNLPHIELDPSRDDCSISGNEAPYFVQLRHSRGPYEESLCRLVVDARGCKGLTLEDLRPGVRLLSTAPTDPRPRMLHAAANDLAPNRFIYSRCPFIQQISLGEDAKRHLLIAMLEENAHAASILPFLREHWRMPASISQATTLPDLDGAGGSPLRRTDGQRAPSPPRPTVPPKRSRARRFARSVTDWSRRLGARALRKASWGGGKDCV